MNPTEKTQMWESVHSDYLAFTVSAHRATQVTAPQGSPGPHLDRNVVDTIRYSYDCLESSLEFVYHMGRLKQLPITIPVNWLTRYIERNWGSFSLPDRLGILAHAWPRADFWTKEDQFSLFREWKKVRDGLTHPVPFGTEIEREILDRRQVEDGATLTVSRFVGEGKQIGSASMSFRSQGSIARFSENPASLRKEDATKAFEILLLHLARLEELYFRARTTRFAYFDTENNRLLSPLDLLSTITRSFADVW